MQVKLTNHQVIRKRANSFLVVQASAWLMDGLHSPCTRRRRASHTMGEKRIVGFFFFCKR